MAIVFHPEPLEEEFVSICFNDNNVKIPKVKLILFSEFYAKNVESLGDEIIIDETASSEIVDLFVKSLTNENVTIPENLWPDFVSFLQRWECNDLLNYMQKSVDEYKIKKEEQERIARLKAEEEERKRNMPKDFDIIIKIYDGRNEKIHIKIEETVNDLKKKVFFKTAILPAQQFLYKKDDLLEDTKTLESYELAENMVIDLLNAKKKPPPSLNDMSVQLNNLLAQKTNLEVKIMRLRIESMKKYKAKRLQTKVEEAKQDLDKSTKELNAMIKEIDNLKKQIQLKTPAQNTPTKPQVYTTQNKTGTIPPPPPQAATSTNRTTTAAAAVANTVPIDIYVRIDYPNYNLKVPIKTLDFSINFLKVNVLKSKNLSPTQYYVSFNGVIQTNENRSLASIGVKANSWLHFIHR